jgi:rhodanese-related sulfurtransferase
MLTASWPAVAAWIAANHPQVPSIEVEALSAWLADARRAPPLLLDVRAAEEFAVSFIPGARSAPTIDAALTVLGDADCAQPIVVYCAVGVRSARMADSLMRRGYTNVANLSGSIFAWANRGLPLHSAAGPTDGVHPYDRNWAELLSVARRAAL